MVPPPSPPPRAPTRKKSDVVVNAVEKETSAASAVCDTHTRLSSHFQPVKDEVMAPAPPIAATEETPPVPTPEKAVVHLKRAAKKKKGKD